MEVKLADLEPRFRPDNQAASACDSLLFVCPKCFVTNKGVVGTHSIRVVNYGRAAHVVGAPSWIFRGSSADDFTLDWAPGSDGRSSVQIVGGCEAHFNIVSGEMRPANAPGGQGLSW